MSLPFCDAIKIAKQKLQPAADTNAADTNAAEIGPGPGPGQPLVPLPTFVKDEYLNYWKIVDEDASNKSNTGPFKDDGIYKEYRKYYIDETVGYPTYIKNIDLSALHP